VHQRKYTTGNISEWKIKLNTFQYRFKGASIFFHLRYMTYR